MRVLVVEDDDVLCEILKTVLTAAGFAVDITSDGEEGLYLAEQFTPDAIVLDVILPTLDGLSLLKKLRQKGINIPVLLLTTQSSVEHKVEGLNLGADDYLPKPFDHEELVARLRSILRRNKGLASSVIQIGNLEINVAARTVQRAGQDIDLTAKEFNLLEYLALHADRVVSRTEILEHLYDRAFESDSNLIDVYITYLRNKIDRPFPLKLIKTVRGQGYCLKDPDNT
jgi:DNA-binding response OmpR family regulator